MWAPSLTFASPPEPKFGLEASPSGVVEYCIDGDTLTAQYRSVPALRGLRMCSGCPSSPLPSRSWKPPCLREAAPIS